MRDRRTATSLTVDPDPTPVPEIEDLSEQHGTTGRASPWTLVVLAVTSAIIGFGFVGHEMEGPGQGHAAPVPSPAATARPASNPPADRLTISRPSDGDVIEGPTIKVLADARVPLGTLHVAAVVGTDELGSTDLDVTRAGPIAASVPIIEPGWPTRIELKITQSTGPAAVTLLATRSLLSTPRASVGILGISSQRTASRLSVSVDGWAPAGPASVQARLVDRDGRDVATADATIASAEGWGGAMLVSRPFKVVLEPAVVAPGTVLRLVLTWRDPATGEVDSSTQTLAVPQPARVRAP